MEHLDQGVGAATVLADQPRGALHRLGWESVLQGGHHHGL
jgi:hypothetical protein